MKACRLSHLENAGASAALEIARQGVLADIQEHISLSITLDMAQCVSDFDTINTVDMCKCVFRVARGTLTTRTLARS